MSYQSESAEVEDFDDRLPKSVSPSLFKKGTIVAVSIGSLLILFLNVNSNLQQLPHSSEVVPLELSTTPQVCSQPDYSKTTLKLAKEESFVAMFRDDKDQKKFEASDMTQVGDFFYVVFDNLYAIGRVATNLPFTSLANQLVGPSLPDSGFEALFYDQPSDHFFFVQESIQEAQSHFHAVITEAVMHEDSTDYKVVERCVSEYRFTSDNKGFEGAIALRMANGTGELHILGLCEGNYCEGGAKGRESGNGRLVVLKKHPGVIEDSHGVVNVDCAWDVVKIVSIPPQADFVDYSSIAMFGNSIAISSQESSALWLGKIDPETFELSEGVVYYFPRDHECRVQYCNIEGITWLNDHLFAAVSDKMKSGGRQDFRCLDKDQSLHVFVLP